jgi:hypothetical protein
VNDTSLNSWLSARSSQLLSDLEANAPDAGMIDLVGGRRIAPVYVPEGGFRQTSAPYTASVVRTITGNIPDQYRTSMTVSASAPFGSFSRKLWIDEIYGRQLEFDSNFNNQHVTAPAHYFNLAFHLRLDGVALNSVSNTCATPSNPANCMPPGFNFTATLVVDHPYAAQSGSYADRTVSHFGPGAVPTAIVHGWGRVSPELGAKWGRERGEDRALPNRVAPLFCEPEWLCSLAYLMPAGDQQRQRLGASWLAQFSRMAELQGAVGQNEVQHHHSVGFVHWDYNWQTFAAGPNGPWDFGISDQQTVIDLKSSVSVSSRANDGARTRAVSRAIALAGATLEGSVVEQSQDLPDGVSTASRFAWGNRPDNEDPCNTGARRFYNYSGATQEAAAALARFEGSESGCAASNPITPASRTRRRTARAGPVAKFIWATG